MTNDVTVAAIGLRGVAEPAEKWDATFAITRDKQLVVLVGTKKALGIAVRAVDTGRRYTALKQRLRAFSR